ncbi:MAG: radical SAM protein [Desulfomonilia bacterium]|jgi:radical SAM superfamily enzyme YgiQ (UPF0313 family)
MEVSRTRRIHFVEFNARINTLGSLGPPIFPKYGSLLLASLMRERGFEVRYFLEGVSSMDFEAVCEADAVCLPVFAPALTKVRDFCLRVLRERPGLPVIMGGPQVCFFPETVLDCCTCAVRCEGDEVLPLIVKRLEDGGDLAEVPGISFMRDGRAIHTPEGKPPEIPATIPDITLIEGFNRAKPRIPGLRTVINTLQTTRGCRFRCRFCPTHRLFQGSFRNRDIESVIADIRKRASLNEFFFVVDNDFCSDRRYCRKLLERIIDEGLEVEFAIFERHEIGRDPEMLDLLYRAGVRVIIVGVESLLDRSLEAFDKRQTSAQVLDSIKAITDAGMSVLSTFVLGADEDTPQSAERLVEFVLKHRLILNLFVLHDLETREDGELLIPLHRRFMTHYALTDPDDLSYWDYMTGSFVTYFPRRMKPSTLQRLIFDIPQRCFSHAAILRDVVSPDLFRSFFGIAVGYGMKRVSRNLRDFAEQGYLEYLERIEDGLYDEREELMEDRLASLHGLPLPPKVQGFADVPHYRALAAAALAPAIVRLGFKRIFERI